MQVQVTSPKQMQGNGRAPDIVMQNVPVCSGKLSFYMVLLVQEANFSNVSEYQMIEFKGQ